jgi:hypothetical protein
MKMDRYLNCLEEDIANSKRELDTLIMNEQEFDQEYNRKRQDFNEALTLLAKGEDARRVLITEAKEQLREAEQQQRILQRKKEELCQVRAGVVDRDNIITTGFNAKRGEIKKTLQELESQKQKVIERLSREDNVTTVPPSTLSATTPTTSSTIVCCSCDRSDCRYYHPSRKDITTAVTSSTTSTTISSTTANIQTSSNVVTCPCSSPCIHDSCIRERSREHIEIYKRQQQLLYCP